MTARRVLLMLMLSLFTVGSALAGVREDNRVSLATQVLEETQQMRDQSIPSWLLQRAEGIAILPNVVKVGFIFGGRGGKGILSVRDAQGHWSNPIFLTLAGGSWGFQAGIQSSDIILIFTTRRSIEGITGGRLTLGVDASVAAGPVGRQASAATDIGLSEIYSYSRSTGLFAGIALDGSALGIDGSANSHFYDRDGILGTDIVSGLGTAPVGARKFVNLLEQLSSGGAPAAAPAPAPAPAAPTPRAQVPQPPPAAQGLESGGATTYPAPDGSPRR